MKTFRHAFVSLLFAGLFMLTTIKASMAALLPLYSFAQADMSVKNFHYDNATGNFSSDGMISFQGLGGGLPTGTYALDLAGHATGAVSLGIQTVAIDTFKVTSVISGDVLTAGIVGDVFLTALTPSTASISGTDNGISTPTISFTSTLNGGQDLNANPPGYPGDPARDFVFGLSGVDTGFSVGTAPGADVNNFDTFDAVISGNGDFTPNVPEPGTVGMLCALGVGGGLLGFKRLCRR